MQKLISTPKTARQKRFFLVMPFLALPFLTMMFWALGGGKGQQPKAQQQQQGFNIQLPDANVKDDRAMDKMSYYDKAQTDSAKFRELLKNDPGYRDIPDTGSMAARNSILPETRRYSDPATDKIYEKLALLNKEINKPQPLPDKSTAGSQYPYQHSGAGTGDAARLQQMMQQMNQPAPADPELQQLNGMLDKILEVQHPERVQEQLRQATRAQATAAFNVSPVTPDSSVSLMDNTPQWSVPDNGFYSLENPLKTSVLSNAVQAVVHESKTIVNGSVVKLRLMQDIFINGTHIPKDNFVFGTASLQGERLEIKITSIRYLNSLFPVALSVYDMDGLNGINIPGAITRDVAKQSADRSVQSFGLTSLDPSWQAQVTGAGIETAKSLLSSKVKLVKVYVKAGYQVLLRDDKPDNNNAIK